MVNWPINKYMELTWSLQQNNSKYENIYNFTVTLLMNWKAQ
jgi:hypothetical protein